MSQESSEKYCVFQSGGNWYALPALSVRQVSACPDLYHVPGSCPALAGVCHLRNEFLAVVRLSSLPGGAIAPTPPYEQLMVLTGPHGSWGLLVEQVISLDSLESSISPEIDGGGGFADVVIGAATYRDEFVRLLDPNGLYRLAERRLQAGWASDEMPGVVRTEQLAAGGNLS